MGRAGVTGARLAAHEVLRRVRERQAYGPETLATVLSQRGVEVRDAAHGTRLVFGALQWLGTLDAAVDRFLDRPGRVEPRIRDILRVAAYEVLFTDTPDRAAVDEAVEAARRIRPQAASLVNAVLRRLSDAAPDFPWGDPGSDTAVLALYLGHPRWLAEALVDAYGEETANDVMIADSTPAPLYLRHNPFRTDLEHLRSVLTEDGAEPVDYAFEGCLLAEEASAAVQGRALAEGLAVVADAAAQVAPLAMRPAPGSTVLEVASGRGTKTLQLQAHAVAGGGPAHVYAVDVHAFKSQLLERRMSFLGVPDVHALTGDATALGAVKGAPSHADAVLVDAPCSGTGALRRHPEKRWRIDPGSIEELSSLQARMLASAASLVRPGGTLVYSTCSILPAENESVAQGFLDSPEGSGFVTRALDDLMPPHWAGHFLTPHGWFRSLPTVGGPDGHFVATFTRMERN